MAERDRKALLPYCGHYELEGAEGPMFRLGRWPVLWQCVNCGRIEVHL